MRTLMRSRRRLAYIFGVFAGVLLMFLIKRFPSCKSILFQHKCIDCSSLYKPRNDIYIGILSSKEFLDRRVKFIQASWGVAALPHLHFYMNHTNSAKLPVIRLQGVRDDEYPPRRKVFRMLEHWCSHFVDSYNWFIRADDDSYIKIDRLKTFLHSLDSEKKWYIGQSGEGKQEKRGKIGFPPGYFYCMGGPGMIFSRGLLKSICPHLNECQSLNVTEHEDIEVGRCVLEKAKVSCTSSYEMMKLFYAHYSENNKSFKSKMEGATGKAVLKALTIHPLKDAMYSYRIHAFILNAKAQELRNKIYSILALNNYTNSFLDPSNDIWKNDKPWTNVWKGYRHYQTNFEDQRKRLFGVRRSKVREAALKSLQYLRRYQDKPVKYLRSIYTNLKPNFGICYEIHIRLHENVLANVGGIEKFESLMSREVHINSEELLTVIVPFSGRSEALKRFLKTWRSLKDLSENVRLLIAQSENSRELNVDESLNDLKSEANIETLTVYGNFSRGVLLHTAVKNSIESGIVCFIDVDIKLGNGSLVKMRRNTKKHETAFLPIMFSEFDPRFSSNLSDIYHKDSGYWRESSFGQLCVHRDDYLMSGGFPQNIKGWGKEDIELGDHLISKANLRMFRSADPGLIHKYHPIHCDKIENRKQKKMCSAVKSKTFASRNTLAIHVDNVLGLQKTETEEYQNNIAYER
ncbi:DgyrCDS1732 [Dimorphilus gyrociliatus]|uniref:Hexosyltransferase n=1 Tax=Dimorphilus gyrociliatus TaxID=2664684 RepID=A0A7I8V8A9_9ANNE|nr:DgyrCDS1732 [Dimorphilus gyrociliatus]